VVHETVADGAERSTPDELLRWALDADKVLVF
jgi:sulfur relay (sulfurtransferase) complex TusBCD TusD component (DsrE family)